MWAFSVIQSHGQHNDPTVSVNWTKVAEQRGGGRTSDDWTKVGKPDAVARSQRTGAGLAAIGEANASKAQNQDV
jgi:hypothetical protein